MTSGTAAVAFGLAAAMWIATAVAQTTTTTTTTQPGTQPATQPGVRPGTPQPTAPGARTTSAGRAQELSAREASVLRGPRSDQLEGLLVGSFIVHPRLALDVEYDDNIFRTNTNRVSDFVFRVRPGVTVDSDWDEHAFQFYALGELARLASNSSENYEAFQVGARGRFDINDELAVNGEAEFARIRLGRGQPGSVGPGINSVVHQFTTGLSVTYNGDPLYVRFGPRFQRVTYVQGDGGINQDYNSFEFGGRIGYKITPELSVFIDPSYQWVRYDQQTDPFGFQRNSHGFDIRAGVAYDITQTITAELGLGYFRRKFSDPRLAPISGLSALARLYWNPTDTISIELEGRRGVTEYRTALAGVASGNAVNTGVQLRVGYLPIDEVLFDAGFAWQQYDYASPLTRTDNYYTFDIGAKYFIIPQVFVGPRYIHERRNSSVAGFNYNDNRYMLTLGGQL
ncbi:MAG: outer membrane beta-barrel protein [Alphaproteobacteria bacterium]|nr:outer membrane beta-barrel protein [Alphaproteobacteria bacterium]MCW5740909.1 outer membrane beta-barrel protein [Alphaproteobacteria bacterium]